MTDYPLDIILPLWNRPHEVRASLASFVADSPLARLIMVSIGSERETESILEEFAEALDDRALLVATRNNIGSVAALNLGLSRSTAPYVLVATPFTRLGQGWFDPVQAVFEQHPDAGAVVLKKRGTAATVVPCEADHGSFDAMVMVRALYDAAGGFDESLDGGEWTLRDFARRALSCGYRTLALNCRQLSLLEYAEFGSIARREERARLSRQTYAGRWGEAQTFLLVCSDALFGVDTTSLRAALLDSARKGNRIITVACSRTAKQLAREGYATLHENISLQPLPRLFPGKALRSIAGNAVRIEPATIVVSDSASLPVDIPGISFAEFLGVMQARNDLYFNRGVS